MSTVLALSRSLTIQAHCTCFDNCSAGQQPHSHVNPVLANLTSKGNQIIKKLFLM